MSRASAPTLLDMSAHAVGVALPPHLTSPLPACAVIVDRHTHKNGGSTMRGVYEANDRRDHWGYWGYGLHQHGNIANKLVKALTRPPGWPLPNATRCEDWARRPPLRLIAEHHYSRMSVPTILSSFGPSSPLQHAALRCRCRVVLVTRLREPLSFYVSFYRWTVSWRQQRNASAFGSSMVQWAPRNLQSSLFMEPLTATWAEFVGVNTEEGRGRRKAFSQFDMPAATPARSVDEYYAQHPAAASINNPAKGKRRLEELERALASFDLVGLVERFDETLLMLADLAGLQRTLYTRSVPESTNPSYRQPSFVEVCPDRKACEERVKAIAPVDHSMYAKYAARFDAKVAQLGAPFQRRLAAFRASRAKFEAIKQPEEQFQRRAIERDRSAPTTFHYKVPVHRLHCPLGQTPDALEGCQRLFADTPFRYNWRHTFNSCCERVRECAAHRVERRRPPVSCRHWLPVASETMKRSRNGRRSDQLLARLNASIASGEVCRQECILDPDPEPSLCGPYHSATAEAAVAVSTPIAHAATRLIGAGSGCADVSASEMVGKPWSDFGECEDETDSRENLVSPTGPCARDWWIRLNCRSACGLCGLEVDELINLEPWAAVRAARLAAADRGARVPPLPKSAPFADNITAQTAHNPVGAPYKQARRRRRRAGKAAGGAPSPSGWRGGKARGSQGFMDLGGKGGGKGGGGSLRGRGRGGARLLKASGRNSRPR